MGKIGSQHNACILKYGIVLLFIFTAEPQRSQRKLLFCICPDRIGTNTTHHASGKLLAATPCPEGLGFNSFRLCSHPAAL